MCNIQDPENKPMPNTISIITNIIIIITITITLKKFPSFPMSCVYTPKIETSLIIFHAVGKRIETTTLKYLIVRNQMNNMIIFINLDANKLRDILSLKTTAFKRPCRGKIIPKYLRIMTTNLDK